MQTPKLKHLFLFEAQFRSTSKRFHVEARDEDAAQEKAPRSKEAMGCIKLTYIRQLS